MPGMEVFTISGPPSAPFPSAYGNQYGRFGAGPDVIWRNRRTGLKRRTRLAGSLPRARTPSRARPVARPARRRSRCRTPSRRSGTRTGTAPSTSSIDGVIGPATVKAMNHALSAYIGAGPLQAAGLTAPQFLQARLTKADIQRYAGALAALVATAVRQQGGTIPPPPEVHGGGGGGGSRASSAAAQAAANAPLPDGSSHPNMLWFVIGGAVLVLGLGFYAAHKKAA